MKNTTVSDLEKFLNNLSLEKIETIENIPDKDFEEMNNLISTLNINRKNYDNINTNNTNIDNDKTTDNNTNIDNTLHNNTLHNNINRCNVMNDFVYKDNNDNQVCINVENPYEKENKMLKSLHITSKIIRFFKEKKIEYVITHEENMLFIVGKYNTKHVNIILKIDINMADSTFNYYFTRKLVRNCRFDPYNNAVRKFQGTYKGKFTEKEINNLMSYIK